jgi:glyoxylate utilization-related uncharacterized protein
LADVVIKRLDEFESNHEMYYRVRSGLGVSAFGLSVERWPAGTDFHPEHAEAEQEEVYVVLEGSATLVADGGEHALERMMFVRLAPHVVRKIVPGDDGVTLLCIGGVPGGVYTPPAFTEEGAPWR